RSSISNSATKIEWSSNPNAVDDCFFGIWYSQNSPVDISRQPDNIIWYQLSQTEYQTTLNQNAPTHIAIAVIRPGNEAEIGIAQELFLDWNTTLPKAPHNVVITNK
ncbi:MAG: hypothetical protein LBQ66_16675, partial [Planctomycetaceae bacterium]|nr:hypothetical protein [Planctomycetaceae bacterium]